MDYLIKDSGISVIFLDLTSVINILCWVICLCHSLSDFKHWYSFPLIHSLPCVCPELLSDNWFTLVASQVCYKLINRCRSCELVLLLKPSACIISNYFLNNHVQQKDSWWENNITHLQKSLPLREASNHVKRKL